MEDVPIEQIQYEEEDAPLGVSVHHLATEFLQDVLSREGLSENSVFYEVENLSSKEFGVVRRKGQHTICPHNGTPGAAYVDCLKGDDHVGPATHMLSWTWSYTVGDVVQTLLDYCLDSNSDPKRTYVWICILCVNQHRVVECSKSGILDADLLDFEGKFRSRVLQIGNVLVMMGPWHEPLYLKRIWCIFEYFTATEHGIPVSVIMPHREANRMAQELVGREGRGVDALYVALQGIDVQQACASVEEDKVRILHLVEESVGFNRVNQSVGEHFRCWVKSTLERIVTAYLGNQHESLIASDPLPMSSVWARMGKLFTNVGDHTLALKCYEKALEIRKAYLGNDHLETATMYESVGSAFFSRGKYKKAHEMYSKCLSVRESKHGSRHPLTGISYRSIGWALASRGQNDEALTMFRKCQVIQEANPATDPLSIAETYTAISTVLQRKRVYSEAIEMQKRAVDNIVAASTESHPSLASAYNSLGDVLLCAGRGHHNEALAWFRMSLEIRETTLGRSHPDTAASYYSIGLVLKLKQDYQEALSWLRQCRDMQEKYLDPLHPNKALTYTALASTLAALDDFDEALWLYTKAEMIQRFAFGESHPLTIKTRKLKHSTAFKKKILESSRSQMCCFYLELIVKVAGLGVTSLLVVKNGAPKFVQDIFLFVFGSFVGIFILVVLGLCLVRRRRDLIDRSPDVLVTLPMLGDQETTSFEVQDFIV